MLTIIPVWVKYPGISLKYTLVSVIENVRRKIFTNTRFYRICADRNKFSYAYAYAWWILLVGSVGEFIPFGTTRLYRLVFWEGGWEGGAPLTIHAARSSFRILIEVVCNGLIWRKLFFFLGGVSFLYFPLAHFFSSQMFTPQTNIDGSFLDVLHCSIKRTIHNVTVTLLNRHCVKHTPLVTWRRCPLSSENRCKAMYITLAP